MEKNAEILIVGHDDVIENSIYEHLLSQGFSNVYSIGKFGLNPAIQITVYDFFQRHRPQYVFLGSVRSGGIEANQKYGADFLYENLESQNNILYSAYKFGAKKVLYIGASCVYPKDCPQPMKEEHLLTGPLEKTSESYSIAKIAGIKLCEAYKKQYGLNVIAVVPPTVYGPGSDTNLERAHVLGALVAKFVKAAEQNQKEVVVWGSGNQRREFLYRDDFAEACMFLINNYDSSDMINAGCGEDISIKELAQLIADVAGFKGNIQFDASKSDGASRKLLDNGKIAKLGWKAKFKLREGIQKTMEWHKTTLGPRISPTGSMR